MVKCTSLIVICAVILVTHMLIFPSPAVSGSHHHHQQLSWFPTGDLTSTVCTGSMAECLAGDEDNEFGLNEFQMDSESNRRILQAGRRYISYAALSRNSVPCSRRGASYYNCRNGGQANPYTRGCNAITRCRR